MKAGDKVKVVIKGTFTVAEEDFTDARGHFGQTAIREILRDNLAMDLPTATISFPTPSKRKAARKK